MKMFAESIGLFLKKIPISGGGGSCFCPVKTGAFALVIASSHLQRVLRIFVKRLWGEGGGYLTVTIIVEQITR